MSDERARERGVFSATDAAFTGFRLIARRPATLLVWTGVLVVFNLVSGVLTVLIGGSALSQVAAAPAGDPAVAMTRMTALAPLQLAASLLSVLIAALFYAGINRAVLRPQAKGLGHLALGADELRQLALMVLFFLLFVASCAVAGLAGGLAGGAGAAAAGPGSGFLTGVLVGLAVFCAFVFVAVRLSLASALTFDRGRIDIFGSWALTRGRFWALFGAYALCAAILLATLVAVFVILGIVAAVMGGGGLTGVMRPDLTSVSAYFSPLVLASLGIGAVAYALWFAVIVGAPAGAYVQLRAGSAAAADAF